MTSSFNVNKADLQFILKQIGIAESTSLGYTSTPLSIKQAVMNTYGLNASDAAIAPYGLRTVDGTYNNILIEANKSLGAADTLFPRLTTPVYLNEQDEAPFFGVTNTDYAVASSVVDSDPRIISNLIVDMSVSNPAAIATFLSNPLSVAAFQELHPGMNPVAPGAVVNANDLALTNTDLQTIPNQSPDIGLSPGFNSWMTFFGQFFDHGLDLVTKGNNGTVYVPLQPDDPLIAGADGIINTADDLAPNLRFMALTRATPTMVDPDGAGPLLPVAQFENTTTAYVDQNQTYTSNASHQVFLREYVKVDIDGAGGNGPVAVSTGRLLDGTAASGSVAGAIGNWGEVKAQALTMLGIKLDDFDIHNAPLLVTDQYGKFIPGTHGYAQLVMAADAAHATNWVQEGTAAGITTAGAIGTGHAFLNDIAHHAAPGFWDHDGNPLTPKIRQTADTDPGVGDDLNPGTYDDEMLNAHFITGDGRGNENIGLTTVHSIFHSEHNRMVEANKATILQSNDLAFLNEWLRVDVAALPTNAAQVANLQWDGERLFQASRFSTEMQYQHLVFEEFARRVQPAVNPFVFNSSPNVDPSIMAEFAHTVYRFGHSMLTGTVDRLENDLTAVNEGANTNPDQKTLLAMFLNPQGYIGSGATIETINANLIRGLSRDVGNAIDEFIVSDVRSNLLGLPLDLAVLNIVRGRETGIPSFNETRKQLYNNTGLADLKPFVSWYDFAQNITNAASIVNFIAAYGTHETITAQTTLAGKRAAAEAIVFDTVGAPADRLEFLNGTDAYAGSAVAGAAGTHGGLNLVDLWIGGLAEKHPEFGGMLGNTFNYVFEAQMENLQNGDRMYYLSRTQGTNFLNQLEPNTFSDLVMRNTALGDVYSTHLNAALFVTPDHFLELDRGIAQTDYNGAAVGKDPLNPNPFTGAKVVRNYTGSTMVDGNHDFGGYLKVSGGEHYVLGGTEGNDILLSDKGIDALWGDGGNDYLNAGTESDNVFGGEGDDIIEDPFGDDLLRGNQGNDVITSARGADIFFGDQGQDYIVVGQDAGEVFAGQDDDFVLGGSGSDGLMGNEGNDWIEGGAGFDGVTGDNSELFFNSPIIGHDVLFGQGDETDYDAESGDDIMSSAGGTVIRYNGMFGFDWGIAKNDSVAVNFDLTPFVGPALPNKILRDRFDLVEAASGWKNDDHLDGDDRSALTPAGTIFSFDDHLLTADGIARITGLGNLVNPAISTLGLASGTFRDGNILLGGDGDDFLRGKGGNDILDGDAWLNVRIKIVIPSGSNSGTYSAESMNTDTSVAGQYAGKVFNTNSDGSPDFSRVAFGGRSLTSLMLDRTINPGQMSIVREILDGTTVAGETDDDTAIFQGNYAEYNIEGRVTTGPSGTGTVTMAAEDLNRDGFISVIDTLATRAVSDGHDLLKNIEQLSFADQIIRISGKTSLSISAVDNLTSAALSAVVTGFNPPSLANYTYQWYSSTDQGVTSLIPGATSATRSAVSDSLSRVVVNYSDLFGSNTLTSSWVQVGTVAGDTLNGSIAANDILIGLSGNDSLAGGVGDDTMYGGGGNDVLDSHGDSIGVDSLSGGTGDDTYGVYNSATTIVENAGEGNDTVWTAVNYTLSANIENMYLVGAITGTGNAGDNSIFGYGAAKHTLNGAAGNDSLYGGTGADILSGGADNDYLNGGLGADSLSGGVGNDVLDGSGDSTGLDTFAGGAGDDVYGVYNSATTIIENVGEGNDTVWTAVNYTLAANVENMYLVGALTGTGSVDNNLIVGYGAGNNTIYGLGGDDSLYGGEGDDYLNGGMGHDYLNGGIGNDVLDGAVDNAGLDTFAGGAGDDVYGVYSNDTVIVENAGEGNDTVWTAVNYTLAANVENMYLVGTLVGTGNASNNLIVGYGADNHTISGMDGNDTLYGGTGSDTINGDAGDDSLNGGIGIDRLSGGAGNDVLDGSGDSISIDIFAGGADDDTYGVYNTNTVIIENAGEGTDHVWTAVDYTLAANVENMYLVGALTGNGNADNNIIVGYGADNHTINGLGGNDTLYGDAGADTLDGGAGADTMNGGSGVDIFAFRFGQSSDTLTDRVLDFTIGTDKIDIFTPAGVAAPRPTALTRANDNSIATTLLSLATSVYADANGATAGNQALGNGNAAIVVSTIAGIAGTYLIVDDGVAGFNSNDLVVNITGFSGSLPALGAITPVSSFFKP
jgi:Ca2+-binding RTX toxin-like protein